MYHSVSDQASSKYRPFALPTERFAAHLDYFTRNHYTPLSVTQLIKARLAKQLPERPVVLTFDDGLADFYTGAFPLLQKYNFTATLYVATAYVNSTSSWLKSSDEGQRPMLTWDQLKELSAGGIECGGHSQTHTRLDTLPVAVARQEIFQCKALLEEKLGCEISSFAYPYGYKTAAIEQLVQEAGYSSACAVRYKMSSSSDQAFGLARLIITDSTDTTALAALLEGRDSRLVRAYKQLRSPAWQLATRKLAQISQSWPLGKVVNP
jgi:peptidoglycan/xylan/chitin deacetylase (PgdA/CDA1 family)